MQRDRHQYGAFSRVLERCPQALCQEDSQAASEREIRPKLESGNQFAHWKFIAKRSQASVETRRSHQARFAVALPGAIDGNLA